jgi:hypothetical protein
VLWLLLLLVCDGCFLVDVSLSPSECIHVTRHTSSATFIAKSWMEMGLAAEYEVRAEPRFRVSSW